MNYIDNYDDKEMNPKVKKNLPWIFIGILIVAIGISVWTNLRPGVHIGDEFLYRKSKEQYVDGDNIIKITDTDEGSATFDITMYGEKKTATLKRDGEIITVKYDDGETISGKWGVWQDEERFLGQDGMPVTMTESPTIVINNEQNKLSNAALAEVLYRINFEHAETKGHWAVILIGTIAYILGMICFYYPEKTALLFRRWRYDYVELSDTALFFEKAGGVAVMVLGIVVILHFFHLIQL